MYFLDNELTATAMNQDGFFFGYFGDFFKSLCSKDITHYKQLISKDTGNEYLGNKEKHINL